jgi:recombination protein RecA
MAPPFRVAEFDILFNEGISRIGSIIDMGVDFQVIDKKGTWFSYQTHRLGQGREAAREYLKNAPALVDEIEKIILQKYAEKGGVLTATQKSEEVSKIVEQLTD